MECDIGFTASTWRENREEVMDSISPIAHNSYENFKQSVGCRNCGLEEGLEVPRVLAALGCDAWGVSVEEISV